MVLASALALDLQRFEKVGTFAHHPFDLLPVNDGRGLFALPNVATELSKLVERPPITHRPTVLLFSHERQQRVDARIALFGHKVCRGPWSVISTPRFAPRDDSIFQRFDNSVRNAGSDFSLRLHLFSLLGWVPPIRVQSLTMQTSDAELARMEREECRQEWPRSTQLIAVMATVEVDYYQSDGAFKRTNCDVVETPDWFTKGLTRTQSDRPDR